MNFLKDDDRIITKRKVSEEIVERITNWIKDGHLPIGEKLPSEIELAEHFGVSRASVREAITILSALEIVESIQGKGTFVKDVLLDQFIHPLALSIITERKQALELMEMRQIVEVGSAELAALRRDEQDIIVIRQSIENMEKCLVTGESEVKEDFDFHLAIAHASKNSLLIHTIEQLADIMLKSLEYIYEKKQATKRLEAIEEHEEILLSIEMQDPKRAARAMSNHLMKVEDMIKGTGI